MHKNEEERSPLQSHARKLLMWSQRDVCIFMNEIRIEFGQSMIMAVGLCLTICLFVCLFSVFKLRWRSSHRVSCQNKHTFNSRTLLRKLDIIVYLMLSDWHTIEEPSWGGGTNFNLCPRPSLVGGYHLPPPPPPPPPQTHMLYFYIMIWHAMTRHL